MKTHRADCLQYICTCEVMDLQAEIRRLMEENARYKQALETIAEMSSVQSNFKTVIARQALKGE